MFLIVEKSPEKNKKYLITEKKKQFSNGKGTISYEDVKKTGYGGIFKLGNKQYLVTKPTLSDYILYGIKRQTQIIYPTDSYQIVNLLGASKNDVVFESGIGSGALSLVLLNSGVKLYSFEKRQEFIDLATQNINLWESFVGYKFDHKIINFDIVENEIPSEYYDFFDKGILDIRYPEKAKQNVSKILKNGGILLVWVPTANQVIEVLKEYEDKFFVDEIVQIRATQWIRIAERFRPEDWQVGERGFIIKMIKLSNNSYSS